MFTGVCLVKGETISAPQSAGLLGWEEHDPGQVVSTDGVISHTIRTLILERTATWRVLHSRLQVGRGAHACSAGACSSQAAARESDAALPRDSPRRVRMSSSITTPIREAQRTPWPKCRRSAGEARSCTLTWAALPRC